MRRPLAVLLGMFVAAIVLAAQTHSNMDEKTAKESLTFRKRTQPLDSASAGCIFQNPQPDIEEAPDGIPWSAGALVDRALPQPFHALPAASVNLFPHRSPTRPTARPTVSDPRATMLACQWTSPRSTSKPRTRRARRPVRSAW